MEAMPTPDLAVPYAAPKPAMEEDGGRVQIQILSRTRSGKDGCVGRYAHEKTIEAIAPMNPKKGAIASPSAACTPVTHAARHARRRATLVLVFIIARVFSLLVRLAL
jgi:hypothetical protein